MEERAVAGEGTTGRASPLWYVVLFLGTAGLAGAITLLFHVMRSVMDVGGACGSGGQYEIAVRCPDGVPLGTLLSIFGGLCCLGLTALAASKTSAPSVILLAWPALFISLGVNFLQYGISPPDGSGVEVGLIVCGVVFELMGVLPLLVGLSVVRGRWRSGHQATATPSPATSAAAEPLSASWVPGRLPYPAGRVAPGAQDAIVPVDDGDGGDAARLVDELRELAELHRRGDLTDAEFTAAKRALLAEAEG